MLPFILIAKHHACTHLLIKAQQSVSGTVQENEVGIHFHIFSHSLHGSHYLFAVADKVGVFAEVEDFFHKEAAEPAPKSIGDIFHVFKNRGGKIWGEELHIDHVPKVVFVVKVGR